MFKKLFKRDTYKYIDLPIYSIATFHNLAIFSGGGGHGISNQILIYDQRTMKLVDKVETHSDLIQNMVVNTPLRFLACSSNADIMIYKIDVQGKLDFMWRFRSDFLLKNSTLNSVQWRQGSGILACGGDDKIARVYQLRFKDQDQETLFELLDHTEGIKSIDLHKDSTIMVSNDNCRLYVTNYATKSTLAVLDSSVLRPSGSELQSGYFLSNNQLIIVSYQPRGHTFVSKFNTSSGRIRTKKIIADQSCLTSKSPDLKYIAVGSGNGTVQVIETKGLKQFGVSKNHDMVVKGLDFISNSKVVSGTPECSYHIQKTNEQQGWLFLIMLGVLILALLASTMTVGEL